MQKKFEKKIIIFEKELKLNIKKEEFKEKFKKSENNLSNLVL